MQSFLTPSRPDAMGGRQKFPFSVYESRMRQMWRWIVGLGLAALSAGCGSLGQPASLRPKRPDEYRLPPDNDPRYSKPAEIPREYLDPKRPRNPFEKDNFQFPQSGMPSPGGGLPGRPGGI